MPSPRPLRSKSPADVHFEGRKTARRQRVRHSGGFTPLNVSGAVLWADFADASTLFTDTALATPVTADADAIGSVLDKSRTHNLIRGGAAGTEGTYKVNIVNGKSICRLDGAADFLKTSDTFTLAQPFTIISAQLRSTNATSDVYVGGSAAVLQSTGTEQVQLFAGSTVNLGQAVTTSFGVAVGIGNGASSKMYWNGGTGATADAGTNNLTTTSTINIGADATPGNWLVGDFGEVLVYNVALTSANLNLIGNYLAAKWGTTWTAIS